MSLVKIGPIYFRPELPGCSLTTIAMCIDVLVGLIHREIKTTSFADVVGKRKTTMDTHPPSVAEFVQRWPRLNRPFQPSRAANFGRISEASAMQEQWQTVGTHAVI
jgi:hypothetical protein